MGGANAKVFSALLDEAQTILRSKFGMELVGLRARPEAAGAAVPMDVDDDAEPTQGKKKGPKKAKGPPAAKGFILRSILSDGLIALINEPRPISVQGEDAREDRAAPTGGEGDGLVDCGALIDWQKGDGGPSGGIALVGLMWVVLGTILVHDRVMSEGELKAADIERR